MSTVLVFITKINLILILAVSNIFSFATGKEAKKIEPKFDDCRMSFAAISDVHLQNYELFSYLLECGLSDMSHAKTKLDALVLNGDNTNLGYVHEWRRLEKSMKKYNYAKQTILTIGNHDTWCGTWDGDLRTTDVDKERFYDFTKKICDMDISKPYFSTEIAGYPAIILGSEGHSTSAYLSDEQLSWFEDEMNKAEATGKPIFVFLHQPLNGTHGLPYNWEHDKDAPFDEGGVGDQSDAVKEIMAEHKNVFYISGHMHAGFATGKEGYSSIENFDGITLVNLPSYSVGDYNTHGGFYQSGTGYVAEVYDDFVLFRARNFITGMWITKYDVKVPLT